MQNIDKQKLMKIDNINNNDDNEKELYGPSQNRTVRWLIPQFTKFNKKKTPIVHYHYYYCFISNVGYSSLFI